MSRSFRFSAPFAQTRRAPRSALRIRWFIALAAPLIFSAAFAAEPPPNIVYILADDLGWGDVGWHGGMTKTPHLDRLAREGVEFLQHYSAASCSPTRTALLTGRYWSRFGVLSPVNTRALPWDIVTLPGLLKSRGYQSALIGKWHLGSKPEWSPNRFGFDYSYGSLAGGVGPYNHLYKKGEFSVTWHRNGELITDEGHVTDLITGEAVSWIERPRQNPFFLYVAYTAIHLPLQEPAQWLERVPADVTDPVARQYAASIMHLDDAVGAIVSAVNRRPGPRNTVIIFSSDNGATNVENNDTQYPGGEYAKGRIPGNNRPWRGWKTELYEGGIRVPTVVHWPGRLAPRQVRQPVHVVDWMPTLAQLAGHAPQPALRWDGRDLTPLLHDSPGAHAAESRTLYWTTPRERAVREGDWKLIVAAAAAGRPETVELFDLARDPGEQRNLRSERPDKVEALTARLREVGARDRDAVAEK